MQQLADSHTQDVAIITQEYRAKQLDERKEAEKVSSVFFSGRIRPPPQKLSDHVAPQALQQLADSHAQHVERLHDNYRAKQLDANEKVEKVSSTVCLSPAAATRN
jgi:hypothetical protein